MTGTIEGRKIVIGNQMMMMAASIDVSTLEKVANDLRGDGATAIFVAIDGKPAGVLAIADPIKPTTAEAIRALRAEGIRVVMLTGDNKTTAQAVGRKLEIDEVEAEVLPEDKGKVVDFFQIVCTAPVVDQRDVTSSNGDREKRYVISTPIRIGDREWEIEVTLTNRDAMSYRMLLGRQAIGGGVLVDPASSFRQPRLRYKLYPPGRRR